jgi:arylsulfatase A-like enzyme
VILIVLVVFGLWYATQTQATFGKTTKLRQSDDDLDSPQQRQDQKLDHVPLNIVLFYADDWTMNVLGKLNKYVKTPNVDTMADNGILFTNNCVTSSICWMSRATLATGTYASRHQQRKPLHSTLFTTHPWNETLFPLLKANGYYTGLVGKWHAPQPQPEMSMAFDYTNLYYGWHWMPRNKVMRHVTDLNLEDSIHFLRTRPMNQTFALVVSFFATHAWDNHDPPYEPQKESKMHLYINETIPRPKTATREYWRKMPHFFNNGNEGRRRWKNRFDAKHYQDSIKDLYRMATEVDFAVGQIIELLKEQGVYNETLMIFTTDNGNMHGEHGLAEKWYPYEESIRVPLVIVDPRMHQSQHGTRNDEFTLNIDLAPTILGAAKISPSSFMQGRDIARLYLQEKDSEQVPWRQDWFYEFNQGDPITAVGHEGKFWIDASFALVTKEWKYIYWPQHHYEQIFHRSVDQYEEFDLLNRSEIQPTDEIYSQLKSRYTYLKNWVQSGHPI